jgi:transcriptional regulator of acetoin/glycerol metabolism
MSDPAWQVRAKNETTEGKRPGMAAHLSAKDTCMHDTATRHRFIELRARGWSLARIAKELGVSRPTLYLATAVPAKWCLANH